MSKRKPPTLTPEQVQILVVEKKKRLAQLTEQLKEHGFPNRNKLLNERAEIAMWLSRHARADA